MRLGEISPRDRWNLSQVGQNFPYEQFIPPDRVDIFAVFDLEGHSIEGHNLKIQTIK